MELLLLTSDANPDSVLPSLTLLAHHVRPVPADVSSLLEAGNADVAVVDARTDLAAARGLCRLLGAAGSSVPVVAVLTEGGYRLLGTWLERAGVPGAAARGARRSPLRQL